MSQIQAKSQKHSVPLVLSFFVPGLGQIVKGHIKKGFLILFAPVAVIIIVLVGSISASVAGVIALLGKVWIGWIVLYVWQLVDAYNN